MDAPFNVSADVQTGVGTVEKPVTVRVVATFADGTEQAIGERTYD